MFLFEDPDMQLRKYQQILKFHKKQQTQYISFLEKKVKSLMQENNNLHKSMKELKNNNNNIGLMNKTSINKKKDESELCSTPNIINMNANMKKIEIKNGTNEKNFSRYSTYVNSYEQNLNSIKNLNAQTALEQNYSSMHGGSINVNINNDNSNRRNNYYINGLSSTRNIGSRNKDRGSIKNNYSSKRY